MKMLHRAFLRFLPIALLVTMVLLFAGGTREAMSVVNFHAELFEQKKEIVIIDAGHGGEDGGTVGADGTLEKDINLAIALKLRDLLVLDQYQVILIRDGDYSVGDSSLGTVAARKRSDTKFRLQTIMETGECIYIGIHQNYFQQSKYSGAQIFYSGNRPESALLAETIRSNIVADLQPENTRESKQAESNIYILYNCQVPAVFVECGFLSNPEENALLRQPDYQAEMANSIHKGLNDYLIQIKES